MKSKTFLFALALVAFAFLAFSLWFSPRQAAGHGPNVPALAAAADSITAPAEQLPAPMVAEVLTAIVANIQRSPGTLLALLAAAGIAFWVAWHRTRRGRLVSAINTNPANWGTHAFGKREFLSDGATTRYFLGKKGSDAEHLAVVAATADEPIAIYNDGPTAAEQSIGAMLLGPNDRTVPVIAGGVITNGADLYSAGNGKVIVKPTAAGTYWGVGSATGLGANAADGDTIAMIPRKPKKLIVIAALGNTNSEISGLSSSATTTQAEFNALRDKCEELADDVRAIAAALDGNADVALATT